MYFGSAGSQSDIFSVGVKNFQFIDARFQIIGFQDGESKLFGLGRFETIGVLPGIYHGAFGAGVCQWSKARKLVVYGR